DESRSNRVSDSYHDDGNCGRCAASRIHRRRGPCDDDINIAVNKLSHSTGIVLECSLRPANVDGQILPFDVAAFAHTITERAQHGRHRRHGCEDPDAPNLRLLRASRERPCRRTADEGYELAAPHSTTSATRPISGSGTVRPSALAVFMLMTSSTLVACWTGSSAGVAPLRMRPM